MPYLFSLLSLFFVYKASAQVVVVQAARIDGDRSDPSRSVTVLNESDLSKIDVVTVADVLKDVPGVNLVRQGGVGQTTSVFIRGARAESTLVLVDGVEVNDASSPSCGFDFSSLSVSNIERIEIYRGPQGVRFGPGALGGVISIVTKEGRPGFSGAYQVEGGSFETKRALLQASGGSEKIGYALALDGLHSKGFSAAAGGTEPDGAKIYSASTKLIWRPTTLTEASASFRFAKAQVDIDRQGGAAGDDPNDVSSGDQFITSISARSRFFDERLKQSGGVSLSDQVRRLKNEADSASPLSSRDDFFGRNFKVQTDSDLLLGENHILRFGLQWRNENARSDSEFNGVATAVGEKSQSVFGKSLTYLFENESWFADAGVRHDESTTVGGFFSTRASAGKRFAETKLTLTYGTGAKLPSLYQLYSSYGDEKLSHETADTVDLSIEQSISKSADVTLTYFSSRSSNLIDFNLATNRYFNVLKSESSGFELEAKAKLNADLQAGVTYTYLDAKDSATGLGLLRRPFHSASASLTQNLGAAELSFKYRYRGERPDIDATTFQRMQNASYDLWDIGVAYKFSETFKFSARAENLLDRKYEEVAGYGTPGMALYVGLTGQI